MNRKQRKILTCAILAGAGLVLAANPSNAMPWGDALRPAFIGSTSDSPAPHDRLDEPSTTVAPDPTIAPPATPAPERHEPTTTAEHPTTKATEPPAAQPSATEPVTTEPVTTEPVTTVAERHPEPTTAHPATTEPAPHPGGDGGSGDTGGSGDQPPATEPEHPVTTAPRTENHNPVVFQLGCQVVAGASRANVACNWSGSAPDGAVRLLVLRNDGRVRLSTEQVGVRSYVDGDAGAGRTFSYVVVVLDANGVTLGHSNASVVTLPAAPTTEPTNPPTTVVHVEPTTTVPH